MRFILDIWRYIFFSSISGCFPISLSERIEYRRISQQYLHSTCSDIKYLKILWNEQHSLDILFGRITLFHEVVKKWGVLYTSLCCYHIEAEWRMNASVNGPPLVQILAYWNIVYGTQRDNLLWNLNRNLYIFIHENAFEYVAWKIAAILSRPQCVIFTWHNVDKKRFVALP